VSAARDVYRLHDRGRGLGGASCGVEAMTDVPTPSAGVSCVEGVESCVVALLDMVAVRWQAPEGVLGRGRKAGCHGDEQCGHGFPRRAVHRAGHHFMSHQGSGDVMAGRASRLA
jgi:hypothetical protein